MQVDSNGGIVLRRFRDERDYRPMAAVLAAACGADGVESLVTAEMIAYQFTYTDNFDHARDIAVAEAAGRLVGYSYTSWYDEVNTNHRIYHHLGHVHPDWRGRGIGSSLAIWNRQRLTEIATEHRTERSRIWESYADDADPGAHALARRLRYEVIGHRADMVRPHLEQIPTVPLAQGVEIRATEQSDLPAIWEAHTTAFDDHPGARVTTERDYARFLNDPHQDRELWRVAWDGDRVAGQIRSFINHAENQEFGRRRGYTEHISTVRRWRRRGLSRALLCLSLEALRDTGMNEAGLGVYLENPFGPLRLYKSLGFEIRHSVSFYRKPFDEA